MCGLTFESWSFGGSAVKREKTQRSTEHGVEDTQKTRQFQAKQVFLVSDGTLTNSCYFLLVQYHKWTVDGCGHLCHRGLKYYRRYTGGYQPKLGITPGVRCKRGSRMCIDLDDPPFSSQLLVGCTSAVNGSTHLSTKRTPVHRRPGGTDAAFQASSILWNL